MKRKSIILCFILNTFFSASVLAGSDVLSDEQLNQKILDAQKFYQEKYQSLVNQVNQTFGVDFFALKKEYEITLQQLQMKLSILDKIQNPNEKAQKIAALQLEYADSRLYQYLEANSYFENEIEKDHLFVGELLDKLEKILEFTAQKDEIFKFLFYSPEFKNQFGLVLKRVVWQPAALQNVSAETTPLNIHSLFGDKTKTPVLIKFTPVAFYSLSFLRSIMIHELNHVCFYKDPHFSDVTKFEGSAVKAVKGSHTHYFKSLNALNPSYQYYLIHEYYSFKTQMVFDDLAGRGQRYFRMDEANRKNIEQMMQWTYAQLNDANKEFVRQNPDPPILRWIHRFYSR